MKTTTCLAQVTCVTRTEHPSPYQRISHVGGYGWRFTQEQAIQGILGEQYVFYICKNGKTIEITIGLHDQTPYLKTNEDVDPPKQLLRSPECSCKPVPCLQRKPKKSKASQ